MTKLSVLAPVYQNEKLIKNFVLGVSEICDRLDISYEIILVNDGSTDESWHILCQLVAEVSNLRIIDLTHNFGQHRAVLAGCEYCNGEWIVIIDSDLEEDPELIPTLFYRAIENQANIQVVRKALVRRNFSYKFMRKLFYYLFKKLSDFRYVVGVSNYGIYHRTLISQMMADKSPYPFIPALVNKYASKIEHLEIDQSKSESSPTSYSFRKLIKHAVLIIVNNSKKPLYLIAKIGFITSLFTMTYALYILIDFVLSQNAPSGWTSLALLISTGFSVTLFNLGIISLYFSTFMEYIFDGPKPQVRSNFNSQAIGNSRND